MLRAPADPGDLGGGPLRDLPAEVEHDDLVADLHDQVHVMLDDDQGEARSFQLQNELPEPGGFHLVHARGRLVQQEKARAEGQGPGDLHPALVAVGQGARDSARPGPPARAGPGAPSTLRAMPFPPGLRGETEARCSAGRS